MSQVRIKGKKGNVAIINWKAKVMKIKSEKNAQSD
jgi:hypothetical protein